MSPRDTEPVKVETVPGPGGEEERHTHPAFGMIGASRVTGGRYLFGSDFVHNAHIVLRIRHAELSRNLSNDWYYGKNEIVEIALSEAQWATFVSSLNMGHGVPCTLEWIQFTGPVPGLEDVRGSVDDFKKEMRGALAGAVDRIDATVARIEELGSGLSAKRRGEMLEAMRMLRQDLVSDLPFVAEQFGEHIEDRTEHAKLEVNAYITSALMRAGVASLGEGEAPIALPPGEVKP